MEIVNDSAEAACIGRRLVNPQLVVVFRRELATKLTGSLLARRRNEDRFGTANCMLVWS
jgi:hypothetical protein